MKFWDTSCIVPLCVMEPASQSIEEVLKADQAMIVWWGTRLECISALVRRTREGILDVMAEEQARTILMRLAGLWAEVHPTPSLRETAERLLAVHPLHAADSLQLAAALVWTGKTPRGHFFICLDHRLREAARKEGFTLVP